jgi:hypothetical protein
METSGREGRDDGQETAPFAETKNAKGCGIRLRDETASARQARLEVGCGVFVPAPYGLETIGCASRRVANHEMGLATRAGSCIADQEPTTYSPTLDPPTFASLLFLTVGVNSHLSITCDCPCPAMLVFPKESK